eukprot:408454-Pyramimonas_sp.AAC.1
MEDHEPLAAAAAKGRSSAPHLNYLPRKVGALPVAAGIELYSPRVDTDIKQQMRCPEEGTSGRAGPRRLDPDPAARVLAEKILE